MTGVRPPVPGVDEAAKMAASLLAPLGDRWLHTQSVARHAEELSLAVPASDRQLLVVAAWWHDLGYSTLVKDEFHPLDGARYVAQLGYSSRLCALIAHHSAAVYEAEERGLSAELDEWPDEASAVTDALWTADMTTGPTGQSVRYEDRLREILSRYEADSIVGRAMRRAQPAISAAIERTDELLPGNAKRHWAHA